MIRDAEFHILKYIWLGFETRAYLRLSVYVNVFPIFSTVCTMFFSWAYLRLSVYDNVFLIFSTVCTMFFIQYSLYHVFFLSVFTSVYIRHVFSIVYVQYILVYLGFEILMWCSLWTFLIFVQERRSGKCRIEMEGRVVKIASCCKHQLSQLNSSGS